MADVILSGTFILKGEEVLLLHRIDHDHYEKPGGKLEVSEVEDMHHPTFDELLYRAKKELEEEVGDIEARDFEYLGFVDFTIPGGRAGRAHAFTARYASGLPYPKEENFDSAEFLPIEGLERRKISPDLKLFLPKLREHVRST